jgi:hypothetical protein
MPVLSAVMPSGRPYPECRIYLNVMLRVVMLNFINLSVVKLSVVMLCVVKLSVVLLSVFAFLNICLI